MFFSIFSALIFKNSCGITQTPAIEKLYSSTQISISSSNSFSLLVATQNSFLQTKMFCNRFWNQKIQTYLKWLHEFSCAKHFCISKAIQFSFEVMHSIHFIVTFSLSLHLTLLIVQLDLFTAWDFRCLQGAFVLDTPHTLNHIHQHRFWKIHLLISEGADRESVEV